MSFRSLRALAVSLTRQGLVVCRPDLSGVGDSAAVRTEEDLARQWVTDLEGVARWLRDLVPGVPLSVVGLRLGASVAAQTPDVWDGAKIAWAPVKGSTWLRAEMVMRRVGGHLPPADADRVEVLGWDVSHAQAASLRALALPDEDAGWCSVEPTSTDAPFWAGEPHFAQTPRSQIQQICDLVEPHVQHPALPSPVWTPLSTCRRPDGTGDEVQEEWVEVGPDRLPGVWTVPVGRAVRETAVVTAGGAESKTGPGGLWARAAVELAPLGVATLRCERRGAGELSDPGEPAEPNPYRSDAATDVAQAIRWARERQPGSRVTGTGLCIAGWMFAMASALEDLDRVIAFNNAAWQPGLGFYQRLERKAQLTARVNGKKGSTTEAPGAGAGKPWWGSVKRIVKSVTVPMGRRLPLVAWRSLSRAQLVQFPADLWRRASPATEFHLHFGDEDAGYFLAARGRQSLHRLAVRGILVRATRWPALDHSLLALASRRTALSVLRQELGAQRCADDSAARAL